MARLLAPSLLLALLALPAAAERVSQADAALDLEGALGWDDDAPLVKQKQGPKGGNKNQNQNQAQQSPTSGQRTKLSVLTWNAENLLLKGNQAHNNYIAKSLKQLVQQQKPDVVLLQEVEDCSLVDKVLAGWACVGSVVPEHVEQKLSKQALGNVLLYNADAFDASRANRVLEQRAHPFKSVVDSKDLSGKSLRQHHKKDCAWSEYKNGDGCKSVFSDFAIPTSVRLELRCPQLWSQELCAAFPDGLRFVNVHLFAGAGKGLPQSATSARRAFQMRSLMALVHSWNSQSGDAPATVYAGDFNTRKKDELRDVVASAGDYGAQLWCPADGGMCDQVDSKPRTHKAGFLDHLLVDLPASAGKAALLGGAAAAKVLTQPSGQAAAKSDHEPLLVEITPKKAVKKVLDLGDMPKLG